MKLQLALDFLDLDAATELLARVSSHLDWVEVGTPMIKRYGAGCIRSIKDCVPAKTLVADMKIMDAGRWEAHLAISNGADIVTVLAAASNSTISEVVAASTELGGQVIADLLGVSDAVNRTLDIAGLGVDFVCLHSGTDDRKLGHKVADVPWQIASISRRCDIGVIVAGGVSLANIREIARLEPYAVVVGSAITCAENPMSVAKGLKEELSRC